MSKEITNKFKKVLQKGIDNKSSDIHFSGDKKIHYRIDGDLKKGEESWSNKELEKLSKNILTGKEYENFLKNKAIDLVYSFDNYRFRINIFYQKEKLAFAIRVLNNEIPNIDTLGLPEKLKDIAKKEKGLFLITGPTGSGKSTTLAALIDLINRKYKKHIITLENPIEYQFENKKSLINQRELKKDFTSFSKALKECLRQDPNIIMLGEMRDLETISTAITAAETGHLVLSTLHTNSAITTIQRMIDMFPSDQQNQIRTQLSLTFLGVLSQKLMPKLNQGLTLATELLIKNQAVSNLIRENKIQQLTNVIETSRKEGMHTMKHSIKKLHRKGIIGDDKL